MNRTLLHLAYINCKQDIIDFLIKNGFDNNIKDNNGVSFPFFSYLIPINYESKHQSSISIAKNDIMPKKDLLLDEILKIKSSLKHVKRRVKKRSYSPLFSF